MAIIPDGNLHAIPESTFFETAKKIPHASLWALATGALEMDEMVLVRAFGDEAKLVRVWRDDGDVVLVCGMEDSARQAIAHGDALPIGFPRRDVYRYDGKGIPGAVDWLNLPGF